MNRLLPIEPDKFSPEQRRVYDAIVAGPRGGVRGPYLALIHVPELADPLQHVGEYLRFRSCLPPQLCELAILITAKHHKFQFAWQSHEPLALKSGLAQNIIDAIKEGRRPGTMQPDETNVFDFTTQLLRNGKISDAVYARTVKGFGTRGAIELGALIGYYILIGLTLQAHEVPLPPGESPPLRA